MAQLVKANPTALANLGAGLSVGLQNLATQKLAQLHQAQERAQFAQALGKLGEYSPEEAQFIALQPEKDRFKALQAISEYRGSQQPQEVAFQPNDIQSTLSGLQEPQQEQPQLQTQAAPQPQLGAQTGEQKPPEQTLDPDAFLAQVQSQGTTLTPEKQEKVRQAIEALNTSEKARESFKDYIEKRVKQNPQAAAGIAPMQKRMFAKPTTEKERISLREEQRDIAKNERDIQNKIESNNKPFREEFKSEKAVAEKIIGQMDALEKLSKKKDFVTGYEYWYQKNIGGLSRSNQLFDKLVNEIVPVITSGQGSRSSDLARETAMGSIPNAYEMDKAGIQDAAEALKKIYSIPVVRARIADDLKLKNNDKEPEGWQDLTDRRSQPFVDKLLAGIVPEEQVVQKEKQEAQAEGGILRKNPFGVTPQQEADVLSQVPGATAVGRAGARTFESLIGTPGDIVDFVSGIVGKVSPEVEKALQKIPLPSSGQVQEFGQKTVGTLAPSLYGKPEGEAQIQADKFGYLLGSILFPVGGPAKSLAINGVGKTLIKGLKLAGAMTALGFLGKKVGGEAGEKAATIGTLLLSNFGKKGINNFAQTLNPKDKKSFLVAMEQPSKLHSYIQSILKPDLNWQTKMVPYLFGKLVGGTKATAVGAGLYAAGYGEKVLRAFNESPEFRKYVLAAFKSAVAENPVALTKYALKADQIAKKEGLD